MQQELKGVGPLFQEKSDFVLKYSVEEHKFTFYYFYGKYFYFCDSYS